MQKFAFWVQKFASAMQKCLTLSAPYHKYYFSAHFL